MKLVIKSICLVGFVGFASVASADHHMEAKNMDSMMDMCDTNKDGKISKDEYTNEKMKSFAKYDKNSDNMLSKEEHEMMANDMHKMMMGDKK